MTRTLPYLTTTVNGFLILTSSKIKLEATGQMSDGSMVWTSGTDPNGKQYQCIRVNHKYYFCDL